MLLSISITACSSLQTKTRSINIQRLIFLNQSASSLRDVQIFITNTNEVVACGYILPKSECSTGFPLREYQGNPFDISWLNGKQKMLIKNILVDVPDNLMLEEPVNAVIVFGEQGRFSASLKQ